MYFAYRYVNVDLYYFMNIVVSDFVIVGYIATLLTITGRYSDNVK